MEDYKSNSHKSKQQEYERRAEKVVKNQVRTREKSRYERAKNDLIIYIWPEVVKPNIKKIADEVFHAILWKDDSPKRKNNSSSSVRYVSYDRFSNDREPRHSREKNHPDLDTESVVFDDRATAEEVLRNMEGIIKRYGVVRVADFYDSIDKTCDYTMVKYGWASINSARVVRLSNGDYILRLPKAMPLDDYR